MGDLDQDLVFFSKISPLDFYAYTYLLISLFLIVASANLPINYAVYRHPQAEGSIEPSYHQQRDDTNTQVGSFFFHQ